MRALWIFLLCVPLVAALKIDNASLSDAEVGAAYSQTFTAAGGPPPFTWSIASGALPAGLTLSSAGQISGTPSAAETGTQNVTIKVLDGHSNSATQAFTINVVGAPIVTTGPLPAGQVGVAYAQTLAVSGGAPPFVWSIASGVLTAGLTLSSAGQISGTPLEAGNANFTVRVTDSNSGTATKPFSINVTQSLAITTASLPNGQPGTAYSQALTASGGAPPYTWSIASGALPSGLTLSAAGQISGTPSAAGTASFTVRAADSKSASSTKALSITVVAPLVITTSSLPAGQVGSPYSQSLAASGGAPPYTWSIASGAPPPGLNLNSAGQISGTPSAAVTANFTVRVSDTSSASTTKALSITIGSSLLITTSSLPGGQTGSAYSQSLAASGGTPPYTWSIASGAPPPGLNLNSAGQISGTPSAAVTANFTVRVSDSGSASTTKALSITIGSSLLITTSSLPAGQVGSPYSQSLAASGGTPPYTWSIASGTLPAGLALNSTGQIGGTPSTAGTANLTIRVTDNAAGTNTLATTLTIQPAQLTVASTSLPNGSAGAPYSQSLQATGGTPPYQWSVTTGALPTGLSMSAGGQVSGTPSAAGTFSFSATVKDSLNASAVANLAIAIASQVSINGCPAAKGTVGQFYNASLAAAGGTPPYSWSISPGQLPSGLTLDGQGGQISGTPVLVGTSVFTLHVSDSASASALQSCSIAVSAAAAQLSITTASLPDGIAGSQYGQTLSATGGQPPYSWTLSGGALPPGLSLSANGSISGSPSTAGQFAFSIHAADSGTGSADKNLSIRIFAALTITACPTGSAVVGQRYSGSASATAGLPPYAWSVSGVLPPGLTLDSGGSLTGTPSVAGTSSYVLVVSDSSTSNATKTCPMNVSPALTVTTSVLAGGDPSLLYSQQLSASGGIAPYSWSVSSGTLPPGLALSSSGALAGRPTLTGAYSFTVRVSDSSGLTADRPLSILVASSISIVCPAGSGVTGQPYSSAASAAGGQPPYTWSAATALPPGLSLSASGQLAGIPGNIGTFAYTLSVADKNGSSVTQQCSLGVIANLTVATPFVPDASQYSPYSQSLIANGGQPPYLWSIVSGTLAPGLNLASGGLLSGAATQLGVFSFAVRVTDAVGATSDRALSINVLSGLVIATCPAAVSEIGFPIKLTLAAAGGSPPYNWSIAGGSLPAGLSLDSSGGVISGAPTQSGTAQFTVMAADNSNQSATRPCSMDVRPAVSISTGSLASSVTGASYSSTVSVSGGQPPYIWTTTAGSLPPGLSLNAGTGQVSGKPAVAGTFAFTVQATDNIGAQVTRDLSITVAQGLGISDCPVPVGVAGQPYSSPLSVVGGSSPYQWSISSGALPAGLSLDSSNAVIAGVPSQAGSASYILQVNDTANSSATRACSISINTTQLTITSTALPDAVVGVQYAQTLAASGGRAPYSWSIVTAGAPDGFSLDASGALAGTPATAAAFTFTVQVTDQDNNVASQILTLNIRAGTPPNVTLTGLPNIVGPAQQPAFRFALDATYPADITGTVTLTFTPDPAIGVDDPAVQFATGGRVLPFTLPANSSRPAFSAPVLALQTGTVAGSIQLSVSIRSNGVDITPSSASVYTIRVDRLAPKIVSLSAVRTTSGVELHIVGFATTRQVTRGVFQFQPANGSQPISVTVPLNDGGAAWFKSSQSLQFGGEFALVQPFTLQGQSLTDFSSISLTLSNDQGNSDSMSVKF